MTKKRLEVDWDITPFEVNLKPALIRFRRYLNDIGLRKSTIDSYIIRVNKFLDFAQSDNPPVIAFEEFRDQLHSKHLSRSSLNNYSFAIKSYFKMMGTEISFTFIKPNDTLPYYFDRGGYLEEFSVYVIT